MLISPGISCIIHFSLKVEKKWVQDKIQSARTWTFSLRQHFIILMNSNKIIKLVYGFVREDYYSLKFALKLSKTFGRMAILQRIYQVLCRFPPSQRKLLLETQIQVDFFLIIKTRKYVIKTGFSVIVLDLKINFNTHHIKRNGIMEFLYMNCLYERQRKPSFDTHILIYYSNFIRFFSVIV